MHVTSPLTLILSRLRERGLSALAYKSGCEFPGFALGSLRLGALLLAVASVMLGALVSAAQDKAAAPAEPKYTEIKYSADASSYRWDGEDRIVALKGSVNFVQGDTTLVADKVDYREKTKTAQATGNLKIYDPQNTITADACTVNFEEKKGTLTGNVQMVAKPKSKSSGASDQGDGSLRSKLKDEVTITCDKIDYFYKEKRAEVTGGVKFVQKARVITADSATYLGKDEILHLAGNVKGQDEQDKHTFSAPKVTISLKEGDDWIEAEKASGTFYVKEEEEKPAQKKAH